MTRKTFHHGNLREALLRTAATELERCGYEALSLRDLAAILGVSHGAPYRHFQNKQILFRDLALQGVERLRQMYQHAIEQDLPPRDRLRMAGRYYLQFAAEKPEQYRLIFASNVDWTRGNPDSAKQGSAFDLFEQMVADVLSPERCDSARIAALASWSAIHGFCMLRMAERIEGLADMRLIEEAVLDIACWKLPTAPA